MYLLYAVGNIKGIGRDAAEVSCSASRRVSPESASFDVEQIVGLVMADSGFHQCL